MRGFVLKYAFVTMCPYTCSGTHEIVNKFFEQIQTSFIFLRTLSSWRLLLVTTNTHLHGNRRILLLRDVVYQLLDFDAHERLQAGLAEAQVPQMAQDEAPLLVPQLS